MLWVCLFAKNLEISAKYCFFAVYDSHNIYVLGLLFFVPASATTEKYEKGFPKRPLPPEWEVVVVVVPLSLLQSTQESRFHSSKPDFTQYNFLEPS